MVFQSPLSNNIVSVALSQAMNNNHPQSFSSNPTSNPSVIVHPNEYSFQNSPASAVTVDLPSLSQNTVVHPPPPSAATASEENGVLLCNLDDLSRYIPENFYSDFTALGNPHGDQNHAQPPISDYLQTVVAGKAITTTVSAATPSVGSIQLPPQPLPSQPQPQQSITIHLPTQPQPIQGVKTVTYVNKSSTSPVPTPQAQMSPGKITQYAFTPSGERIAIHGLPPEATKPGSTLQVQVKGGGVQTLQLSAVEPNQQSSPSKLTVVQELPEVGKVVIQETKPVGSDSINSILEEMKHEEGNGMINTSDTAGGMAEYTTAIPVAVSSDPKKTTIKRVAAPASTVFLPAAAASGTASSATKQSRLIFAGNTLPQGAIPIQINGINAIPISAVKSLPFSLNTLTNSPTANNTNVISSATSNITNTTQTRKPAKPAGGAIKTSMSSPAAMVTKVSNNNGGFHKVQSTNMANINKAIGNNKTCNWVFENGEVCGKTFSKSYNLVVHMRMHEDVRPFGCSLCDQTFRQKAHLQRHETTHGIGVKISNRSGSNGTSAGVPRRKRKRSSRGSTGSLNQAHSPPSQVQPPVMSANLQQRLARVNEQFGTIKDGDIKEETDLKDSDHDKVNEPAHKMRRLSVRLDRCELDDSTGAGPDPNAAFQPYIATPEEAAAAAEEAANTTSPHVLVDAAVTAAVNEAISGIQEAMM